MTLTAAGSALQGTKRENTSSRAHLAAERQTAEMVAVVCVLRVALLRGAGAAPYMEAGIPLATTKWQRRSRGSLRTKVLHTFPGLAVTPCALDEGSAVDRGLRDPKVKNAGGNRWATDGAEGQPHCCIGGKPTTFDKVWLKRQVLREPVSESNHVTNHLYGQKRFWVR